MATFQNYPPSGSGGGAGGAVNISDAAGNPLNSNGGGALKVDGSLVTQPVSGTVAVSNLPATQAVSASSLPLPTGAATETTLAALSAKHPATLGQKAMAASMAVTIASDQSALPITGSITATNPSVSTTGTAVPTSATMVGGSDGTNLKALKVSTAGVLSIDGSAVTQPVSAASLPLPTGAATSALQTTGNTSLSSIDGKLGSLGQKAMSGSAPVVLASDQSAVPTKAAVNANGSGSAAASTVSTVITLTAPANAVGFILQCLDTSTANVRWAIGRTASATLGQQLQPGRDSGFVPCGANVSICAESGTQSFDIQWISQ